MIYSFRVQMNDYTCESSNLAWENKGIIVVKSEV